MEEWGWNPDAGRWRLDKFGYPANPVYISIRTSQQNLQERYDFWREVAFTDFDLDPLDAERKRRFGAQVSGLTSRQADFFVSRSSALAGVRRPEHVDRDGVDNITIGLIMAGSRQAVHGDGAMTTSVAGHFFAYDATRPSEVRWSDHEVMLLVLRRRAIIEAIGDPLPSASWLTDRLNTSPIGHLLRDQMAMFARHHAGLPSATQGVLLDQTAQLALHSLREAQEDIGTPQDRSLLAAATRYIEHHIGEPTLNSERLARVLGCSRATLYRLFSEHDSSVAEYIRTVRLERARQLILRPGSNEPVSNIALACGLYDTSNFSRQFRKRFGVPPTELRKELMLSNQEHDHPETI